MLARISATLLVCAGFAQVFIPIVTAHNCSPSNPWGGGEDVHCGPCDPSLVTVHSHHDYHGTNCESDPCGLTDVLCAYEVVRDIIQVPSNF